jgi:hypothetical protein
MHTTPDAPGAAKLLPNLPGTEVNITNRYGESFLGRVRSTITAFSGQLTGPDNPNLIQHQFVIQQWRDIQEMLVERGAHNTEITPIE